MRDLRAKMHQILFRWGSAPDPAGGAYSSPPDLAVFKGPTSKGREKGEGRKGEGNSGGWADRVAAPPIDQNLGPYGRGYPKLSASDAGQVLIQIFNSLLYGNTQKAISFRGLCPLTPHLSYNSETGNL